jgi:YkoY family integral membrane protein
LLVVLNLILIEGLLSIDNAAVLATLVIDLPNKDRKRALRIGIIFAYVFRGIALFFASWLIKIAWLKLAGGAYRLYLFIQFFYKKVTGKETKKARRTPSTAPGIIPGLNNFWSTVVLVELIDMTFSVDNVFAAVAYTKNIQLIYLGVFIGIITMRIVAGYFVQLMRKFPFLDTVAFTIIGILGLRLCFEFVCARGWAMLICDVLQSERVDLYFSMLTVSVFFIPIVTSLLFNFPKRRV